MRFDMPAESAWRCAVARPYARPYEESSLACVSGPRRVLECPRAESSQPTDAVSERAGDCLRGQR
jgi:hypothetical protein